MKRSFEEYVVRTPHLFSELMEQPLRPRSVGPKDKKAAGIYIFYEDGIPVYAGRTRDLAQRMQSHVTATHNKASYALKRTRSIHPEIAKASYSKALSREKIVKHPIYGNTFLEEIEKIRGMQIRFLEIDDPIDQYLLELYAASCLDLSMSEFDTS